MKLVANVEEGLPLGIERPLRVNGHNPVLLAHLRKTFYIADILSRASDNRS